MLAPSRAFGAFVNLRRRSPAHLLRTAPYRSTRLQSTMSQTLLQGVTLVNAQGDSIQGEELGQDGKALALYFAVRLASCHGGFETAHPALNSFYKAANASREQLDVVFIGSDASAADQLAHFKDKQGPWWMVPFEGDVRTQLKRKYGVCAGAEVRALQPIKRKGGIPTLVVIRPDGEVVDFQAADKVERDGVKALAKWQ
ncbi:hypothetical protein BBJ28_00019208 [Nothophytophthora sp. Chile5]|nr:hypothetical protein BBJ28_00019208 [Nothophytophthora sp. Chile5]